MGTPMIARLALAGAGLLAGAAAAAGLPAGRPAAAPPDGGAGQSIYLRGVLGSGEPLRGTREAGPAVAGADAACVNCHQRSGLGSREGRLRIPPITGPHLFASRAGEARGRGPRREEAGLGRPPYTDETLARAIREGLDPQGRPLGYLMPRYRLGDGDMAALITYLKELGGRRVPGLTRAVLHLATVVTPDADPERRRGMLDVLRGFFARRNQAPILSFGRARSPRGTPVPSRHWQLHVWELTGPASTWRAQLEKRLAAEPVVAVLSGIGGSDWAPVHEFCERQGVPCLFPNVEVPVVAERDFYPVYFSRGVLLEADLIARAVLGSGRPPGEVAVEQVYRAGDSGEAAAEALRDQLRKRGVAVQGTVLPADAGGREVAAAVRKAAARGGQRGGPALVLWLRPADLAALADVPAPATVYLSGLLGGLERSPLPAAWRERALMTYPFDLPGNRTARVDHLVGYFRLLGTPLVDERLQTDTLLACNVLAEALAEMGDDLSRPYLVEELQHQMEHELMTGYYPRLALGANQRFASRGGYLVRFRGASGPALVAEGDWTVP